MKRTLTRLFDFQRYEENRDLQQVIDETHARYATRELSMEDLSLANAAADLTVDPNKKKLEKWLK